MSAPGRCSGRCAAPRAYSTLSPYATLSPSVPCSSCAEPEREKKPVLSGAAGEANVYDETVLQRPERSDRFFSWGDAPLPAGDGGARSLRGMVPSKGGGLPPTVEQAEAHRRAEQGKSEETSLSRE